MTNILLVCYPFIVYLSIQYQYLNFSILFLIVIFILRLTTLSGLATQMRWIVRVSPCIGIFLVVISYFFSKYQLLLYYPVMINLGLLVVFTHSVKYPPTIIERLARMQNTDLPPKAVLYTKKVTLCWCLFFITNGFISLITCLIDDLSWWTLYNGIISYILIAILMGGEWLIRKRVQH